MKIVIVSDLHGNLDAWQALPEGYDELWVLGDLVNYGPQPAEVVSEVMEKTTLVVQGNHDYAVAHQDDSTWSPRYHAMAEATRKYTSDNLRPEHLDYLRDLPQQVVAERDGMRFHLTHAIPSNPLYGRCAPDAAEWGAEVELVSANMLLVGHSHVPFIRQVGKTVVVNPGSLGQPRAGEAVASYAVWQDCECKLKSFSYPIASTVAKVRALGFSPMVESDLVAILKTGRV
ncbi:phosphoesterase [Aquitalea magnusonii]|nr:phosphoesterase [Aquitalea magnusonii]